jgi:hypothetical protein
MIYKGYLRSSTDGIIWSPWECVCEADDVWTCWRELVNIRGGVHSEKVVMKGGREPGKNVGKKGY